MGLFDFFKQEDINQGIEEYGSTAGAILLDVRIPQEYQEGHIPESKNIPLQQLNNIVSVVKNKDIPLFVYCYSGVRSRQATGMLQHMEYMKVKNIGGIAAYTGKVEYHLIHTGDAKKSSNFRILTCHKHFAAHMMHALVASKQNSNT